MRATSIMVKKMPRVKNKPTKSKKITQWNLVTLPHTFSPPIRTFLLEIFPTRKLQKSSFSTSANGSRKSARRKSPFYPRSKKVLLRAALPYGIFMPKIP
jgi:hypothetical protein